MASKSAAEKQAEAEGAAAAASEAQPEPIASAPVSAEERLLLAEERLAAAMEMMAQQSAQLGELLEGQRNARPGARDGWESLSAAEAAAKLQGTVSDEAPGDTLLEDVGERPVTFISKGAYFKAIRIGRHRSTAPNGEQVVSAGVSYDFAPLGTYTARTVEAVAFLRNLGSLNLEFWELGKEPHAAPDAKLIMGEIMEALGDFDDARLKEIEDLESASHKREIVLAAVAKARRVVQGAVPQEPELTVG